MKRRDFLKRLGIGGAAIVAMPLVLAKEEEFDDIKPLFQQRGVIPSSGHWEKHRDYERNETTWHVQEGNPVIDVSGCCINDVVDIHGEKFVVVGINHHTGFTTLKSTKP